MRNISVKLAAIVPNEYLDIYRHLSLWGTYANREERQRFIVNNFNKYFGDNLLDVGCSGKTLKQYIKKNIHYTGIDIKEPADVIIDLDRENLPFKDNEFDCVICSDVLEHLERLHAIFDELCRVSGKSLIISLPNCYPTYRKTLSHIYPELKFYGLPAQRPLDRHRWLFGPGEAARFILERGRVNGAWKIYVSATYQPTRFKLIIRRIIAIRNAKFINHALGAVWARIEFR